MSKIKTAYEKAMERLSSLNLDSVNVASIEYTPKGNVAAARFLEEKDFDLLAELQRYGEEVRGYVLEGIEETFLKNIQLPKDGLTQETNKRAMEGLLLVKKNKGALRQVFSELEYLFTYYTQALDHTYDNLKESFSARLAPTQKALEQQLGAKLKVNVERHPAFLEEWTRFQQQLDTQYEAVLNEQKEKIRRIN
jgi:hypothetical protein